MKRIALQLVSNLKPIKTSKLTHCSKRSHKSCQSNFYWKVSFFKIAQKVNKHLGYLCKIKCRQDVSKIVTLTKIKLCKCPIWEANFVDSSIPTPGLVVMGGDSCPEGRVFESQHRWLDGHFSHLIDVKVVKFVWKDKINEKEAGAGPFLKKTCNHFWYNALRWKTVLSVRQFLQFT